MFVSMAHLSLMAAALLLPIYVQAVAFSVDSFEGIAVGKPMKLSWWGDKTPVTIKLLQGPPEALEAVATIASSVAGESYTWTPASIPAGTYVLSVTQAAETNYSPQFPVASTFTPTSAPAPAGQTPPAKAAAIAAYYSDAGYVNGSRIFCASGASGSSTSAAFQCTSTGESGRGHLHSSADGLRKTDVAVGAAVVGMTCAVMLLL